ncbi:MAG: hypothetical protein U0R51_09620 [Solirubrobacterales bacterium]
MAIAAVLALGAGADRAAAATCDNTWAGGSSGHWLVSANWIDGDADPNNNVPGLDDNVCITQPGTYTVTIVDNGVFGGGSAKSITVGDGDTGNGTVTLAIASSTGNSNQALNGSLNGLSEPSSIATDGVLEMTSVGSNPGQAELFSSSTINNAGVVRSSAGTGGGRLTNIELNNLASGTLDVDYDLTQGFTRTWTNNGSIDVANGAQFRFTGNGGGPTFNQSGGTIATNASGTFYQDSGTFNHTGGSTSGTKPIQLCGPALNAPSGGSGTYDFVRIPAAFCGGGTITGDVAANKTIRLNNDSNAAMGVSVTTAIQNNGTIILAGPSEDQFLGSAVTNNGTFRVSGSGGRLVGNSFTNSATGTIDIDESVNFGFTPTITNNGVIDIADGKTMYVTGSGGGPTFNQSGGTIASNTSGRLFMSGGTFNHTGGSTSGNAVQLCGPALNAPTGGSGSYDFIRDPANFCGGGTISGNIGSGKTVRLNNDSNSAMGVSVTTPIQNNGTLILTGPSEDQFLGSPVTNNGTFQVTGSGARLTGNSFTNSATGTIDVDQDVNFGFTPTITNNGAIDVASGKTMYLTGNGGGPVFNQSGGTMNVAGTFNHGGGAYNHSGGTTTVAAGGQITTNNNPIALSGGTMRGSGTIAVSSLNNTGGTVHPGTSPGILSITGNYSQGAGGTLAVDIAGTTAGTGYSRLAVSGSASLSGELDVTNSVSSLAGTQFQILTGGVSGTFGTLDIHGGLPNYTAQYNAGDVTLVAKGPAKPNPTGTTPGSGANDNAPKVTGTADPGSTVRLYANATCSGTPVATGSAAQFASPGITVNVADNSTTTFHADATNADGKSGCSTGSVTYDEVTPPPAGKVAFTKGPAKKSTKKTAKFTFSAPNAASYECKLDGKGFKACTSPYKVKKLKPGKHKLQGRALGADGGTGATATYKWTVKKKKKK